MANILKKRSSYALGLSRTGVTAHPPAESNSSSNFQLFRKKLLIPAPLDEDVLAGLARIWWNDGEELMKSVCQLPIFRTGLKYIKSPCSHQPILHWSEVV